MLAANDDRKCERLRHLAIVQGPETPTTSECNNDALNDFLASFGSLETLIISAPQTFALKPWLGAVAGHAKTIRVLYLDCKAGRDGEQYNDEEIEEELTQCSKLEQIALNFPSMTLDAECFDDELGVEIMTDAIATLPFLRTIQILDLPTARTEHQLRHNHSSYVFLESSIKTIAEYFFERLPGVTALAVGKCSSRQSQIAKLLYRDRMFYVRGKLVDPNGGVSVAAIGVPTQGMHEMEPTSDLLDLEPEKSFVKYGQKD
ncbi:hypothetical protein LTR37_001781 [Vermiconidia calcicola]|uniref:Uncharacterized protein n=1 Tax=Vermiconidia calcicola TaxID=1690605 RepID=A0ACC3NVP8_9PEZI|nr:hypothetical protein LTR37_001781 [Vermiconidia calcicola]